MYAGLKDENFMITGPELTQISAVTTDARSKVYGYSTENFMLAGVNNTNVAIEVTGVNIEPI